MKVSLNVGERVMALGIFNQFKGDIVTYKAILDDVKETALTEVEKKEINFREEDGPIGSDGQPVKLIKWDKQVDKSIDLSSETAKWLKEFITKKSTDKEITLNDAPLVGLLDKLNK